MPLKMHFLNVGRGDCTIIEFPSGRVGMVDIDCLKTLDPDTRSEVLREYEDLVPMVVEKYGYHSVGGLREAWMRKTEAGLTDPFEYLHANIRTRNFFRLIITHPDMDHMTGLAKLSAEFDVANFWHTGHHDFNLADTTNEEWEDCPYDKADWEAFKRLRSGTYPRSFQLHQGDTGHFWTEDGIDVWAPTRELEQLAVEKNLANITSMILKISYKGVVIVLGGDATADETWPAIWPYIDMSGITVLKASHHGRKTGYYQRAVKEMSPWLTITSVGEKEYDATESYRQYSEHTVSLRQAGDVTITVSDEGQCFYSANVEEHWKPRRVAA